MGQSMSISVGYGVEILNGIESDYEFNPSVWEEFGIEAPGEDDEGEWDDLLTALTKRFSTLTFDVGYMHDYVYASYLLIKSTSVAYWGGSGVIDIVRLISFTEEEENELKQACALLGVKYDSKQPYVIGAFG